MPTNPREADVAALTASLPVAPTQHVTAHTSDRSATVLETPRHQSRFESLWAFGLIAALVVGLGGALWWGIVRYYSSLSERAEFGNLFGGINTLFAGLGFAALTYTLILQQRALALQRSQLADQQREVAEQNRRGELQALETMLFQLLSFHHDIAKEVHWHDPRTRANYSGRSALRMLADELRGIVSNESRKPGRREAVVIAQEAYKEFHDLSRGALDHYFRNLYHIFKFINDSRIPERRRYTSLVRAQLSPAELILLFYNGISPLGEKFNPLIRDYGLLEQLPESELPVLGHKSLYAPEAYS